MKARPVYRWKSFWLGVLVMAFLGWAWWRSYDCQSWACFARVTVTQREGHMSAGYAGRMGVNQSGHMPVPRVPFASQLMPLPFMVRGGGEISSGVFLSRSAAEKITYQDYVKMIYKMSPGDSWAVFVPYWLPVTLFVVAWGSFLGWRWRSQRRLTESIDP